MYIQSVVDVSVSSSMDPVYLGRRVGWGNMPQELIGFLGMFSAILSIVEPQVLEAL